MIIKQSDHYSNAGAVGAREREGIILPRWLQKEMLGLGLVGSVRSCPERAFQAKEAV